jgi:cytochrome P450
VTKFEGSVRVNTNHKVFSLERTISIAEPEETGFTNFIAMDKPKHDVQRKVVAPTAAPGILAGIEDVIRQKPLVFWTACLLANPLIGSKKYPSE